MSKIALYYFPMVVGSGITSMFAHGTYSTYQSIKRDDSLKSAIVESVLYSAYGFACGCAYTALFPCTVPTTIAVSVSKLYKHLNKDPIRRRQ